MSRQGLSLKEIAREHDCTVRTLQRYIANGCNVADPESIKEHAAKGAKFTPRKHLDRTCDIPPDGWQCSRAKGHTGPCAALPAASPGADDELLDVLPAPTDTGAASALKRLQEVEPQLFARMTAAIGTNRPAQIMAARDDWLKVADALRKYEEAVELSKRDSQERMPRADALEALRSAAEWMHKGLMLWLSSETPNLMALKDPHAFTVMAKNGIDVAMNDAFEKSQKSKSPVPEWALETLGEAWSCSPI